MKYEVDIPEGKQVTEVHSSAREILVKLSDKITDEHARQRINVEVSNDGNNWHLRKLLAVIESSHPYRVLDFCGTSMSSFRLARIPANPESTLDENGIDITKYRRLSENEKVIKGDYCRDNRSGDWYLSNNWCACGGVQGKNFTYYRPRTKGWRPATASDVGMRCRVRDNADGEWYEEGDKVFGGFQEGKPCRMNATDHRPLLSWNFCEVFED